MTNNDEVDEGTLQKWDDQDVHLLIAGYDHHKHLFKSLRGKVTKKQVFQKIGDRGNERVIRQPLKCSLSFKHAPRKEKRLKKKS